jgi:type IV secretory pathway VirB2 component (pilin)
MLALLYHVASVIDTSNLPNNGKNDPTKNVVPVILDIVFATVASIAVLMIVIAGFRYIVAHGDPNATAQAKNTILYAIIGLLVSLAAFSIVTFVVGRIG